MTVSGPESCTRLPETSKLKKMEGLEPRLLSGERHGELSLHPQDRRGRTPESCPLTSTHVPLHTFTKQMRTKDDAGRICREEKSRRQMPQRSQRAGTPHCPACFLVLSGYTLQSEREGRGRGCGVVQQPEYQKGPDESR